MSEQLPAPDFDAQNYARSNDKWICGHAAEGKPCRLGPDKYGRCQATAECVPALEKKPGEAKGRWRCTRPGGACENGPLPDGKCCRPITKCSPVPTMRTRRGQVTWTVVALTVAVLLIVLGGSWRGTFINPGELSSAHSGEAFLKLHSGTNRVEQNCAACHEAGAFGPSGMLSAALRANPGPLQFVKLATADRAAMTAIDAACQKCHTRHAFHHPNVTRDVSCSFCHQEHRGTGKMPPPTDANCALCHGDAAVMAAAKDKSQRSVPVIHSFADDHPDFRVHASNASDPNTLKFGHALHLTGQTVPLLPNGQKLDCAYCHQPDVTGAYMRPVNFENHCRVCHSLQFDPETPQLHLPHGDADFVSAFLRSLPKQYADVAARTGVTSLEEQNQFARQKLQRLREQVESGEELEKRVFFSTAIGGPAIETGTVSGATRALYPGCAYCHEVKSGAQGKAEITKPIVPDRWLEHGKFDHAKHASMACSQCHDAVNSKETADIILPAKASCVECHSPRGGVVDSCVTCHSYHNRLR